VDVSGHGGAGVNTEAVRRLADAISHVVHAIWIPI
jgi:hypothetical protein